jgi:hypothetical protein
LTYTKWGVYASTNIFYAVTQVLSAVLALRPTFVSLTPKDERTFMPLGSLRIAILNRVGDARDTKIHLIHLMKHIWEKQGARIIDLFDINLHVPADVLIMHVDASVVSCEYVEFAARYPAVVNLGAIDIRKAGYIDGRLLRGDAYSGEVIVKTNLNYAGIPERSAQHRASLPKRIFGKLKRAELMTRPPMLSKSDYLIFRSLSEVPKTYFSKPYVVQKFKAERVDNGYLLREYMFFNDRHVLRLEHSTQPIITSGTLLEESFDPPHPALLQLREKLGLDYGKIDYALIAGKPFIYDANKTVGIGSQPTELTWTLARHLAAGIESMALSRTPVLPRLPHGSRA